MKTEKQILKEIERREAKTDFSKYSDYRTNNSWLYALRWVLGKFKFKKRKKQNDFKL